MRFNFPLAFPSATAELLVEKSQLPTNPRDNNSNINNSHDNVYGAVIITKVIATVHPVHLMNVD